ncbi:DUF6111 family protein [Roseibium aggregatum]|uniref:Uncharacterized protein n=1 Tax=Roseibium aggregatum TaxID=187304 RepID=A0A939EIM9_9HYPH|nr:DUF6111 family protein [Roseibium aggregatum]MBN9673668.1 hypothetical protein [Roseibium aggregatum]
MLRVFLAQLFLFLLPFLGYGLFLWLSAHRKQADMWTKGPLAWLTLAGLSLVIAGMVIMATVGRSDVEKSYRPSEIRDGVFVPGRFE